MESLERPRIEYRTPADLVAEVLQGRVRIPPFQRAFRWDAADIVRLFDSLVRGFPVGNLLLWQRPAPAQTLSVGPLTVTAPERDDALWVVDGQQRIVSLVGALTMAAETVDPRFRVHLDLTDGSFHTAGARQQTPPTWIPVNLLLDTAALLGWMRGNAWLSQAQLDVAQDTAKTIREYQIPTYVVRTDLEEPLLEIFTRMNTAGKRLRKEEVFQALHSGASGIAPHDLHGLGEVTAQLGYGRVDDRLALRCLLAFRGGDIFRKDFAGEFSASEEAGEAFTGVASALREVVSFLKGAAGIPHLRLLPYSHVVPVLVRYVALHGAPTGRSKTLLRRWVWRGMVAGTHARGVSVSAIRQQVDMVATTSPLAAAADLVGSIPAYPDFRPELDQVHFGHASSKLNVLGLLAATPRDLITGTPLDPGSLTELGTPLKTIIADPEGRFTMANRAVLPDGTARRRRQLLAEAEEAVALSHLIDAEAQEMLVRGDEAAFLERRGLLVESTIVSLVDEMAEWGARDGVAVSDLIRTVA